MLKAGEDSPPSTPIQSLVCTKRQPWTINIVFVTLIHLVAAFSLINYRPEAKTVIMCFALWQLSGLGVTMGYHRLWSHRTYEASLSLRLLLAFLGTIAFQGSIKWWVFRHRLHHRYTCARGLIHLNAP